jgi:hypothetical protein
MKRFSNIHEILLLTTSSFSHQQLCEKNDEEDKNNFFNDEALESACWNGLLNEMLPEIFHRDNNNEKFFLWLVEKNNSYLKICMATYPPTLDRHYTIDPHIFLAQQEMN